MMRNSLRYLGSQRAVEMFVAHALDQHQLGTGYGIGELNGRFDRNKRVVSALYYQRRHRD